MPLFGLSYEVYRDYRGNSMVRDIMNAGSFCGKVQYSYRTQTDRVYLFTPEGWTSMYTACPKKRGTLAFCFYYGAHLLWHSFDNLMQCYNIYFHPELHSFLAEILY